MSEKPKTREELDAMYAEERQLNYRKSLAKQVKLTVHKPTAEEKAREEALAEEREERGQGHGP